MNELPPLVCDGCTHCCQHTDVWLQKGEAPLYLASMEMGHWRLMRKPNGDCIYLDEKGCSIYDRRPQVCRDFDCRIAPSCRPKVRERGLELLKEADGEYTTGV